MDRTNTIIDRLPNFWNTQGGVVRAIVDAMVSELSKADDQIDHIDSMIGIDGTIGDDLDKRWGALLSLPRRGSEGDAKYRNRLKTSISNLAGGTASALQYAVAVALNIDRYPIEIDSRIIVMDAWEYAGQCTEVNKSYANVVCYIDMDAPSYIDDQMLADLTDAIKLAKASGVGVHVMWFKNETEESSMVANSVYTDTINVKLTEFYDVDPSPTIIADEHAIIGTEDTEMSSSMRETNIDEVNYYDKAPDEAYSNDIMYLTNDVLYTNCKDYQDIIHTVGQQDIIL